MNLLNRYLLKQFFIYFFTVNAGFVAIYLLVDFFEKFDDFSNAGKPLSMALEYFILTIPSIVDQLGPIFILLSGVISLGILNHSNELVALKAGSPAEINHKTSVVWLGLRHNTFCTCCRICSSDNCRQNQQPLVRAT